jgi:UDP-2,4-diacetamido-2,4,6-trideoxy-beta-L-altropyranose hydrolase
MTVQHIAFRTDASSQIGTGHFMRCLTLADELKKHGAEVRFISRNLPAHLKDVLDAKGMEYMPLRVDSVQEPSDELAHSNWLSTSQAQDAQATIQALADQLWDWVVVDHYALDARWEQKLRSLCRKLMVIDDLADRSHDCDILLDQNFYRNQKQRYKGLIPEHCSALLGPAYVLLRPEFAEAKRQFKGRDGTIKRILVFFGGSDPSNETSKVLVALQQLNRSQISIDVVVGLTNINRIAIQKLCQKLPNATYHCNVSNMAVLILNADLGIGAGGSAMWERCYLGLPTITVVSANNQLRTTEDVADIGAIEYLGLSGALAAMDYANAISKVLANPQRVKQISEAALGVLHTTATMTVVDEMSRLMQPLLADIHVVEKNNREP